MSLASLPLGDAPALRAHRHRVRAIRLGLASVLAGLAVAAFFTSRGETLSPTPLLPPGSSGIIVLDLSVSVENETLNRMYTGLTQLAETHDRFGLVLFSSRAYEALPPNTPAAELRPVARFFHGVVPVVHASPAGQGGALPGGAVQPAGQFQTQTVAYPANPWACCFSSGTEISDGLELARSLILQTPATQRAVWLMSDLADDPVDRAVVQTVARSYVQSGIALHVVGLEPKAADEKFFEGLLGVRGSLIDAKPAAQVRLAPRRLFPLALAVLAGVLAVLLAVNELQSSPLRWGDATGERSVAR